MSGVFMKNVIEKIRNIFQKNKLLSIIALLVLLALIFLIVVLIGRGCSSASDGQKENEKETVISSYFQDTDYPVTVSDVGGSIRITLGGSKLSEYDWLVDTKSEGIVTMIKDDVRSESSCSVLVLPEKVGYTTVTLRQVSSVGGLNYDVVRIEADFMVYTRDEDNAVSADDTAPDADPNGMNEPDEALYIEVQDMRLNTSSSGAQDTDSPYLLQQDRVILPNGGDWTLTPFEEDKLPAGLYSIIYVPNDDEIGCPYYEVKMNSAKLINEDGTINEASMNSCLLLKSESLGTEKKLVCAMNAERVWILSEKEEAASESKAEAEAGA